MKAPLLALAAAAACVLSTAQSADAAITFNFNQSGTGAVGAIPITGFNESAGNALAVGGITAIAGGVGSTFDLYVQTTIGNLVGPPPNFNPLPLGVQLTAVAKITEVVTAISGNVVSFAVAPGQIPASLALYASPGGGADPYHGTGFITGPPILTATAFPSVQGGLNQFQNLGGSVVFDQAPGGPRANPTLLSVNGSGVSTVDFLVNQPSLNPGYFPGGGPAIVALHLGNAGANVPFTGVAPSISFTGPDGVTKIPTLGAVNGTNGPDFQFQISGTLTAVPEPSSVCLMGLGLAGLLVVAHRKRAQVA